MRYLSIAQPIIQRDDISAVKKVLKSGNLAQGPEVAKFESEFSDLVDGRSCVAVNSGTSGLHLALLALGIGPGDEVIVPTFTFAATANSVALTGATPIFVDVDPLTFNMNPEGIVAAISAKTKAIQVVHLYGLPAAMDEILKIARERKLLIVEDCAQAHMASIGGKPVGTFGDAAVFSFYPTKNMTSGEGGMIVTSEENVALICKSLRNQGMMKKYENELRGFNLRMTDIHAALGRTQLKKLSDWTNRRIDNASVLSSRISGLQTPVSPKGFKHVFHQYTIRVKQNRDSFISKLGDKGIGAGVYYPKPVHALPAYALSLDLPIANTLCNEVVSLPVHPSLRMRDLRRISSNVNALIETGDYS